MAKLVKYSPARDLMDIRRTFDRLFDEAAELLSRPFFSPMEDWLTFPTRWWSGFAFAGDNLAVDMYETDDDIIVKAALPGVREQDIEVEERDGLLTIRARCEMEEERKQFGWHIQERHYGTWQRTVQLPEPVKGDKAKAELRDGILTVTLPKVEPRKKTVNRIKVSVPKVKLPRLGKKEKKIRVTS